MSKAYQMYINGPFFMIPILIGVSELKANLIDVFPPASTEVWSVISKYEVENRGTLKRR